MKLALPGGLQIDFSRKPAKLDAERALDPSISLDQWLQFFTFGGVQYPFIPSQTLLGNREDIAQSFVGYVQGAYQSNGIVFACVLARLMIFSEARFQWRRLGSQGNGQPQDLWGSPALGPLEHPWPNGTTGDLLTRMIQDADLAGNFYGVRGSNRPDRPAPGTIKRLRPDWVTIMIGSRNPANDDAFVAGDIDSEVIGYLYHPGGPRGQADPIALGVDEVCHFAPIPDPIASYRGMSWITPILREVMGDSAATTHKLKFFENGATVNMVVSLDPTIQAEAFDRWIKIFRTQHEGAMNAYRTLYLGGGADVKTVGADFRQMDFKVTQGAGETRIAAAAGVPPIIVGLSEGLAAGTYNNYGQSVRRFGDGTLRPLWRNACGSLESLVNVPGGSQLWYDTRDIAFLREDAKDLADIQQVESASIRTLIDAGYKPDSIVAAIQAHDWSRLVHTGLFSVQLQPPQTSFTPNAPPPALPEPAKKNGTPPPGTPALPAKTPPKE